MTDPDTVARALARLADGATASVDDGAVDDGRVGHDADAASQSSHDVVDDGQSSHDADDGPTSEHVVDPAESAMERVHFAAAFLDAGGERRLGRAIRIAEADDRPAVQARGQSVLAALEAFRTAATMDDEPPEAMTNTARNTTNTLAQRSSGEGA